MQICMRRAVRCCAGWTASVALGTLIGGCTSEAAQPLLAAGGEPPAVAGASNGGASLAGGPATGGAGAANGGAASGGAASGGTASGGAASGGTNGGGAPSEAGAAAMTAESGTGGGAGGAPSLPKRVLLYHFSTLDIPSVPAQLAFFKNQLTAWHYDFDDSIDPTQLNDQNLQRYAAVAMINTCFEPFGKGKPDRPQSEVLQRFLQHGGGLFGTH